MTKIAIVGSGFIGRAWAITFARAGFDVALYDANPDALPAARDYIANLLPDLAEFDLLNGASPETVIGRLALEPRVFPRRSRRDRLGHPRRFDRVLGGG